MEEEIIRCPICGWQPDEISQWICDNCNFSWNTFEIDGICPNCTHDHDHTQCLELACKRWSDFDSWKIDEKT